MNYRPPTRRGGQGKPSKGFSRTENERRCSRRPHPPPPPQPPPSPPPHRYYPGPEGCEAAATTTAKRERSILPQSRGRGPNAPPLVQPHSRPAFAAPLWAVPGSPPPPPPLFGLVTCCESEAFHTHTNVYNASPCAAATRVAVRTDIYGNAWGRECRRRAYDWRGETRRERT